MASSVPQASRREQIIAALVERAQAITRFDGFNTDAGKSLVVGESVALGPDDPDTVLVLLIGDDDVATWQAGKVFYRLPFRFQVISKAGREETWRDVEQLLQDVKRAIEQSDDRQLGGLLNYPGLERQPARVLRREPGAVDVGVELVYMAPLQETWGNP